MWSDEDIIQSIRQGEDNGLIELYSRSRQEFVIWAASTYRIDKFLAGDAFQDAIIALRNNIVRNNFKEGGSTLKSYLFVILLTVTVFFLLPGDSPDDLYAQYYSGYPNVIELQQRDENSSVSDAFSYYQQGLGFEANQSFRSLTTANPTLAYPHFYRAICLLNLNKPLESINELEIVLASDDSRFLQPGTWYLALAQLRAGDTSAAIMRLREIATSEGEYAIEASALLDELE